ncbi:DUF3145 domain-containing protein [Glycomyces sp. L485]|uniref:DUF3145 family protein n=1 Tax=Glycomyces sp. L485 TaxID=2909235 RepID=UPI001F4B395C|nr:DUF3145 family protein [Glycomyces sp. L485]MCH7230503.1 DUF3145 domain-containing protein [Glycomyces sp. L485]
MQTRGVIYIHSSPPAVCPHVEWAIGRVLGSATVKLGWAPQQAERGTMRAERAWTSEPGVGVEIAKALAQWPMLRFEVTEDPSAGVDGERIMHVPGKGVYRSAMSAGGGNMIAEDRIRALLATTTSAEALRSGLDQLLGLDWDRDLEPYRQAAGGNEQSWLSQVS